MTPTPVLCVTCDPYLWCLKPFIYLFNKYWSEQQELTIAGYTPPDFPLPKNVKFLQIDTYNYPANRYSDGLIKLLHKYNPQNFVLLLDDYWLTRTVDVRGIATLFDYVNEHPRVLRLDLTNDRLHAKGDPRDALDIGSFGHYDLIETPSDTPYQMSLQAAIWNKKHLLDLLVPGKTPWEVEIHTHPPDDMRVLGTRQWPLRYANAVLKGKLVPAEVEKVPDEHREIIRNWIPDEMWEDS